MLPDWDDFTAKHPRTAAALVKIRSFLPPLNFITLHYAYFVLGALITSIIFWGCSDPAFSVSYTDSLFLTVSAITESGLNTVNLSELTSWQQTMLFLLILFGGSIWVSIWTVLFRKHVFEKRFDIIVEAERIRRMTRPNTSTPGLPLLRRLSMSFRKAQSMPASQTSSLPGVGTKIRSSPAMDGSTSARLDETLRPASDPAQLDSEIPPPRRHLSDEPALSSGSHIAFAEDTRPNAEGQSTSTSTAYQLEIRPIRRLGAAKDIDSEKRGHNRPDFLTRDTVGRNAQFHDLSTDEREQLGGHEYRALKVLSIIVPLYFILWQLLGCIALGAWVNYNLPDAALSNGLNPWWVGIFNGASAFNNSGMSLLDANVIPFENSYFVLITMGLMILAGNTAYPVFLRLILWTGLKVLRLVTDEEVLSGAKATLEFILKYPRRVYTNLFPSRPTWWLLFMLILLNSIDWVAFEVLNLGNPAIEELETGSRILDGLFQALAVRSGGFYVVPISSVYIGLQVLYVIMMYISVYPVVITMRHSNVYEERSLGIYADDPASPSDPEHTSPPRPARSSTAAEIAKTFRHLFVPWHGVGVGPPSTADAESPISFISQQIHGQLAHDLWWLTLAVLFITMIETSHFLADPVHFSVFNVLFEVVSAYGCVGISVGLPTEAYSFCGDWHGASKLVLCLVMLRGRHRGLPVALDRAVRLPAEQLHRDEEEDHRIRRSMTSRRDEL